MEVLKDSFFNSRTTEKVPLGMINKGKGKDASEANFGVHTGHKGQFFAK